MTLIEMALAGSALMAGTAVLLRTRRLRVYRDVERRRQLLREGHSAAHSVEADARAMPSFADLLAVLPDALPPETMRTLTADIERLATTERSYVPTHKKGGTVAYETLRGNAPAVVALYCSPDFHALISRIVGATVVPTPRHDQSSCSVLFYERPGDHIGWHYDHNFYKGRHFTVLLPIVNRDAAGTGLSAARLMARVGADEREIPTPPNQLVVFEGATNA